MGDNPGMERSERVRQLVEDLAGRGIRAVAMTFVDNAGIARVKAVPVQRLGHAVAWGIGASPVFDVFCVDDSITSGRLTGGPAGDLRLYPDLDRLTPLAAQPGWAASAVTRSRSGYSRRSPAGPPTYRLVVIESSTQNTSNTGDMPIPHAAA